MLNCFRVMLRRCLGGLAALIFLTGANASVRLRCKRLLRAESKSSTNIGAAWDSLLQGTIPQSAPDPALTVAQVSYEAGTGERFPSHFFMNARIDYLRTQTYFHRPSDIDRGDQRSPQSGFSIRTGIPYPPAFQSDTNMMYSFLNCGTHGWLSDRVNSNFTFAYSGNMTHVTNASPQLSILDTFGSNSLFQLVSGYMDINGRPTDGILAGTSLRIGPAGRLRSGTSGDGRRIVHDGPSKFSWTIYAGRRFHLLLGSDTARHRGRKFSLSVHSEHQPGIRYALLHQRNELLPISPEHWEHVDVRGWIPHGRELSDGSGRTQCGVRRTARRRCGWLSPS